MTDVACFQVGAFGQNGDPGLSDRHTTAVERVKDFAATAGLGWFSVETNLDDFYHPTLPFQKTHTLRNAAAALLLQGDVDEYLYSSAYRLSDIHVAPGNGIAIMDPIILPILETECMGFQSSGDSFSQFAKTELVARNPLSYPRLDVCVAPAKERLAVNMRNCSHCSKCYRTMLGTTDAS